MTVLSLLLAHWRLAGLAALGAAAAVLLGLWRLEVDHAARLQDQLTASRAAQAQAEAHSAAAVAAGATVAAGAQRDEATRDLHSENEHAIQSAPGAAQGLDPDLNAAGRRGLCAYRGYASDPFCVQLRGPDPGRRSDANPTDAPAAG